MKPGFRGQITSLRNANTPCEHQSGTVTWAQYIPSWPGPATSLTAILLPDWFSEKLVTGSTSRLPPPGRPGSLRSGACASMLIEAPETWNWERHSFARHRAESELFDCTPIPRKMEVFQVHTPYRRSSEQRERGGERREPPRIGRPEGCATHWGFRAG